MPQSTMSGGEEKKTAAARHQVLLFCVFAYATFSVIISSRSLFYPYNCETPTNTTTTTMISNDINMNNSQNSTSSESEEEEEEEVVIYAHIHLAKTAGTEINGYLASRYERVCGHKGYSFDSYGVNERNHQWQMKNPTIALGEKNGPNDYIMKRNPTFNRGRVPTVVMVERGYHNCDWISHEMSFNHWKIVARHVYPYDKLEFHIPCRNPIDYLLSMCNHNNVTFNCNNIIVNNNENNKEEKQQQLSSMIGLEVEKCIMYMDRYDKDYYYDNNNNNNNNNTSASLLLSESLGGTKYSNGVTMKCFNPIPIDPYLEYMSTKLQKKRKVNSYIHRITNTPRVKSNNDERECLAHNVTLQKMVTNYLLSSKYPIFKFCNSCMGSENELF